jgi:hypothetical protein
MLRELDVKTTQDDDVGFFLSAERRSSRKRCISYYYDTRHQHPSLSHREMNVVTMTTCGGEKSTHLPQQNAIMITTTNGRGIMTAQPGGGREKKVSLLGNNDICFWIPSKTALRRWRMLLLPV